MKKLAFIFVVWASVVGLYFYMHRPAPPAAPEAEPPPAPVAVVATPIPAPTPTPVVKHLAPDGVYYLVERISVNTDDGISSYVPGTKVKLLKNLGAQLHVTDGQNEFDVTPSQITNDLDVVSSINQAENQNQSNIAAWKQSQMNAAQAEAQQNTRQLNAANIAQTNAATISGLQNQHIALVQQETNLQSQIQYARQQMAAPHAAIHNAIPTGADLIALGQQLQVIMQQDRSIQRQISALQK